MSKHGIVISNGDITKSTDHIFDGIANTMKLDIDPENKRAGYIKYRFPNNPAGPGASAGRVVYPIVTVEHNFKKIPAVLLYTYDYDFFGTYITPGSYEFGASQISGSGLVSQGFEYYVDNKVLQINYVVIDILGGNPLPYEVTGANFGFRYFLFSNEIS